ncbi:MAG TPA: hypothetical protein VK530_04200 [Candidatus Acidoferrum sp.]|nr:hypothetical protein [Candidatus Acidoferrum sp.]
MPEIASDRCNRLQCTGEGKIETSPQNAEAVFTAAQIALALGKSRQTITDRLATIPADDEKPVNNKLTRHWLISSLPESMRDELERVARTACYRDASSMLSAPRLEWQPTLPLAKCSDDCIAKARQLREALSQAIELRNNRMIAPARLVEIGLADYTHVFGYTITDRHWRELFTRTIHRAGRDGSFDQLELYLPERPQQRAEQIEADAVTSFTDLKQLIASFATPAMPTLKEKKALWDAAFLCLDESSDAVKAKREVITFLQTHAPALALSGNALRVAFDRNYGKWMQGNQTLAALDDGRAAREQDRPEMSEREHLALLNYCSRFENVSLGWRKFLESADASETVKDRYKSFSAARPRVPDWVRDFVALDTKNLQIHIRGPRTAKLNGAYIDRDPNALASGDSDQCDDLTLPLIWFERTPEGLFIGQGQLLVWIDERSWLIYGFDLISDGAYSGFSIRNSWTKKAELHGLPRKMIHVEMGIWKNSKVFVGSKNEVGTKDTEQGLRRLGIRFRHSTLPRGKIIERSFGSLQDLLQMDRGYVGRNQMLDKYERVQKQLKLVRAGHAEPEEFFYEKRELLKRLDPLAQEINTTSKHGKYHGGFSPLEVYQKCFTSPLVKIPVQFRHVLAMNKVETTVGRNGVAFRYGARTFRYKNSVALGRFKGQRVCAWFSPENPDFCSVTDLNGEHPIVVPIEPLVPTDGATKDELALAYQSNANFDRYYKDLHRAIRSAFPPEFEQRRFRDVVVDAPAIELAEQMRDQTAALEAKQSCERKSRNHVARVQQSGRAIGRNLTPEVAARPGLEKDIHALREFLSEQPDDSMAIDADDFTATTGKKIYVLNAPLASAVTVETLRKQFFAVWKRVTESKPGLNRYAITAKHLGSAVAVPDMTVEQLQKMLSVFSAILREAKNGAAHE